MSRALEGVSQECYTSNTWRHSKIPRAPRVTQYAARNVVTLQKGMPRAPALERMPRAITWHFSEFRAQSVGI
jgi:hypothetical protein